MSSIDPEFPQDETHPHRELINGLLQFVGWLTDHPELPISRKSKNNLTIRLWPEYKNHQPLTDSQYVAWVREIARAMDVEPFWGAEGTHFYARRMFRSLEIEGIAILRRVIDESAMKTELGEKAFAELRAKEVAASLEEGQADEAAPVEPARADVDERGFAEVDCADCRGTGRQRDDSSCADCLGKGRVAAPSLQPSGLPASGGVAW